MNPRFRFVILIPPGLKFQDQGEGDAKRKISDVQVCMIGTWEHDRYGTIEFTRANLRELVDNFEKDDMEEVCVDYQHASLSSDPGSAIAAGWIKKGKLYTKERGSQLWATVEWTERAAAHIEAGEYKYISPEIDRDATDKKGNKIGMSLRAVAITNRPFLAGMSAIDAPVEMSEGAIYAIAALKLKSPEPGAPITPPKGGSRMNEKRIREILGLTEDTQVTDEHRNQALTALDEQLVTASGKVQTLTEQSNGKVALTEAEVTALRANAEAGGRAAKELREMRVTTALSDAQRAGKIAGVDTPLYAQVKKAIEADYAGGVALIEALPKVVDFSVRGADGDLGGNGTADTEVKSFIDGRIDGDKAVTMSVALSEAYSKFGRDKVDAWRFKKTK